MFANGNDTGSLSDKKSPDLAAKMGQKEGYKRRFWSGTESLTSLQTMNRGINIGCIPNPSDPILHSEKSLWLIMRVRSQWRLLLASLLQLKLLCISQAKPRFVNGFYYDDRCDNAKKELYFNGVSLHVEAKEPTVLALQGGSAVLQCRYWYEPALSAPRRTRVKWSWQADGRPAKQVLVALGPKQRSFGGFNGRVHLESPAPGEVFLVITELQLNDTGRYHCQVVDGLEDETVTIDLTLRGVVYPYQPPGGRYQLNFHAARQACEGQDSALATFEQLFLAWEEGLDWCNAGWLADGTVHYPITSPREECGGAGLAPGIRSYGSRHPVLHRYDAFCFTSSKSGLVYFLQSSHRLNFTEALQACRRAGARIAKVGQMYSAWWFRGLDRCDAGWLADGSLRYAITKPRPNCGPSEPGVRNFGFPAKHEKHGVYCYDDIIY
ncbi:hypothetical protein GJAV_G00234900 [Gymnothorax javanicus]|nr:hypothetical protein GJAV_G00234900 [Gymnothorax javanicus]